MAFSDESGTVKILNGNSETLWEEQFGYQSGFIPGKIRFNNGRLISYCQTSVHIIDIVENKMESIQVKGKLTDSFATPTGDIIAAVSGQAMITGKDRGKTPEGSVKQV